MNSSTNSAISLSTGPCPSPAELSDAELLSATQGLIGRSNQLLAALLAHLGEVEARGIHRTRACSSLYTYCIYELRCSEDEAFRRVAAARLVRRFPALLDAVATGELHLTGLLMLGPHLTEENLSEVLLRAKHRTKKEIARLVRQLDPLPDVPARIETLGPAPSRFGSAAPTWDEFVRSMCKVRELGPGERPRDWIGNTSDGEAAAAPGFSSADKDAVSVNADASRQTPLAKPVTLSPQRYRVQFTAGEEYVKLVEEARALLSHAAPRATVDEIHVRAMRALLTELKRQKHAATTRKQESGRGTPAAGESGGGSRSTAQNGSARPSDSGCERSSSDSEPGPTLEVEAEQPRQRGRHVPAAVRRAVFERDGGRCTYADTSGRRCAETHLLEVHHLQPFARGGEHTEQNLTLRCRAHNVLAAEEDFGRELIELARSAGDHDPWAAQTRA
jgi:5-methylcytosine-specific restriction endonuclease McrA